MRPSTLDEFLVSIVDLSVEPLTAHVVELEVDLPVEVRWRDGAMYVGAPRWRWRTDFDPDMGRLWVRLATGATP